MGTKNDISDKLIESIQGVNDMIENFEQIQGDTMKFIDNIIDHGNDDTKRKMSRLKAEAKILEAKARRGEAISINEIEKYLKSVL